jgi:hypothetical protein
MTRASQKRPWLAAALALVYPGLGHLYLRSWLRSLMWFGLVSSALLVLVPPSAVGPTGSPGAVLTVAWETVRGLSLQTQGLLAAIVAMEAFDAYVLALRGQGPDVDSCPRCRRELDEDLDFCHWCSASLDG